ncbi:response regulator transcription factor [Chitinophaga pendula]|uniref:response regulator n=1 Tax=Chitinophaga TaxID=79328 RepID=UPI000BB03F2A|nr:MULTISPECIES: response regulator transcription factor [Chitinophaga]ASZ09816.1 DNA-binding response regulator [Chitinophaga sp. MD30]UCJ07243.1 response regulator transcription factor [Chitinophaga pendula]
MIQVIITDDHPIVREGLRNLLNTTANITVTGDYDNGANTLKALETLQPDVLLLDINLPDMNGLDLCKQIRKRNKELYIIALSVHNEQPVIKSMLQSGVNGYVLKNAVSHEIIDAIQQVCDGHLYLCSKTREVLEKTEDSALPEVPRITRREKEILQLVGKGYTTAQIAEKLFISSHTVESHRKNLMEKFKVNSMTSVIKLAGEYNLL